MGCKWQAAYAAFLLPSVTPSLVHLPRISVAQAEKNTAKKVSAIKNVCSACDSLLSIMHTNLPQAGLTIASIPKA